MGQLPSGRRYLLSKDEMELVNLIDEFGRKNEEALSEFYDRTKAFVFSLASRILSDKKDAEDISLEVFMQVWNSASNYDCNRSAPMPWLIMITRSRSIDHLRSKDKRISNRDMSDYLIKSSFENPERLTYLNQEIKLVRKALLELTPHQREAIELAYFFGLSQNEISKRLNQPLGTVKSWIRFGIKKLKEILEIQPN